MLNSLIKYMKSYLVLLIKLEIEKWYSFNVIIYILIYYYI